MKARSSGVRIALADSRHRQQIYAVRHEVYSWELSQHPPNATGQLTDPLDEFNSYIIAEQDSRFLGFISITPPGRTYSIDKYFDRSSLPFIPDQRLFEVRLLTVIARHRGRLLSSLLMYAALRYVEEHGGERITAIGRIELLDLYLRFGLRATGMRTQSGAVHYELLTAMTSDLRGHLQRYGPHLERLRLHSNWDLPFSFSPSTSAPSYACEHGGAYWKSEPFHLASLEKIDDVVTADVLDAWFQPAPQVLTAIESHLPSLIRSSPPADAAGLVDCISSVRGIPADCILPAAGSSELIYLAFTHWLNSGSRVLLVDPCYGEYEHLLKKTLGCHVERFVLARESHYRINASLLAKKLENPYDLFVLVNPNSPTGVLLPRPELKAVLLNAPKTTRIWIDETYIDYTGTQNSSESEAASSSNIFVCKSMSKAYALSGMRVAYLAGLPSALQDLRKFVPPWSVSLPAQVAAFEALKAYDYYCARYRETAELREQLAAELRSRFGFEVIPGSANFLLCHVPSHLPPSAEICARAARCKVYLRDAGRISPILGDRALRIAVKDGEQNRRLLETLAHALT